VVRGGARVDPGLIQELETLRYLDSKAFLADIPVGLQKLMMKTIAPVARLFGYRAIDNASEPPRDAQHGEPRQHGLHPFTGSKAAPGVH